MINNKKYNNNKMIQMIVVMKMINKHKKYNKMNNI